MDFRNLFSKKDVLVRAVDIGEEANEAPCMGFSLNYFSPYKQGFSMSLSSVFAAVELISNSLAQIPIHIKNVDSGDINNNHPLNDVFKYNLITKFNLMKQLVSDMLIHGNGIAYITRDNGIPSGLIYCPKSTYTINYNLESRKLTYTIPSISGREIQPKDVIHIYKNSNDGVTGKGFLYYAERTIKTALAAESLAGDYFESGCGITGILKSLKKLSKKQQAEIQLTWNNTHNGVNNKSSLAVLGVDLDYIPLSSKASEAQLLETRLFSVLEVARFFSISPTLLGDLSKSSYNTLEQAQLLFLLHTLSPYIEIIQDEFNRKLCYPITDEYVIDLDEDHLMKSDKSSMSNYLQTLVNSGIITINEARHQLGFVPKEGCDDLIIPYTDLSLNKINKSDDNTSNKIEDENKIKKEDE